MMSDFDKALAIANGITSVFADPTGQKRYIELLNAGEDAILLSFDEHGKLSGASFTHGVADGA